MGSLIGVMPFGNDILIEGDLDSMFPENGGDNREGKKWYDESQYTNAVPANKRGGAIRVVSAGGGGIAVGDEAPPVGVQMPTGGGNGNWTPPPPADTFEPGANIPEPTWPIPESDSGGWGGMGGGGGSGSMGGEETEQVGDEGDYKILAYDKYGCAIYGYDEKGTALYGIDQNDQVITDPLLLPCSAGGVKAGESPIKGVSSKTFNYALLAIAAVSLGVLIIKK